MPVATVGDAAEREVPITAEKIEAFAEISGDENPIHLDDAYAADTTFDGRIAHGMIAGGVISAALAALPGDVIYLSQDLRFEAPVRPGDSVRASVAVTEELDGDRVRVATEAFVDERDERVVDGEAVVLSVPHES